MGWRTPTDGIDGAQLVGTIDLRIRKQFFNYILTIVERAFNANIVDICVEDGRHLRLLDFRDLTFGMKHEYREICLSSQAINSRTSGISRGCSNDGQVLPLFASLALVSFHQEILKEVSQKL